MDKELLKCCGYVRVSQEEQLKGYSLEFQAEALREFAKLHGYNLVHIYEERAESAKNLNRTQFQKMLKAMYSGEYDTVLAWQVDRISRNYVDFINLISDLKKRDKNLIITTTGADTSNENDDFQFIFQSYFATLERKKILERANAGMEKRAKEGYYNGGKVFGYDSVNKKLVVNETESKIINKVFQLRAKGYGYKAIALYLNDRGFKTKRGNKFSINTIKIIVNNVLYIGKIKWGEYRNWSEKRRVGKSEPTIVEGKHEPIISKDLWDAVQSINKENRKTSYRNTTVKGEFLLTGILRCPACGYGTVMHKTNEHPYYMCQQYHNKGKTACRTNLIKKDFIEQQVESIVLELIKNSAIIDDMIKYEEERNNTNTELVEEKLKEVKAEITVEKKKSEKLDEVFLDEIINMNEFSQQKYMKLSQEISLKLQSLEENKKNLEQEIKDKSVGKLDKERLISLLNEFEEIYYSADRLTKKKLLKSLIKEIKVSKDRTKLKSIEFWFLPDYSLPLSEVRGTVS